MARRASLINKDIVSDVNDMVERVLAEKNEAIEEIAARVREDLLVPLCERYGLEFFSGNGDYFFSGPGVASHIGTAANAKDLRLPEVAKVFEILDIDTDTASRAQIGHCISNVLLT